MALGNWLANSIGKYLAKGDTPTTPSFLCDFDRICYEVKPGDVLLIEGQSRISRIIQRVTLSPWSHAALYIGRIHDVEDAQLREFIHQHYQGNSRDQLIIESYVGKGTFIDNIHKYKYHHVRICRPNGLTHVDAQKIISIALNSHGKDYNIRHFLDLGRFLLASKFIPRKLGSTLFERTGSKATQDICSAMLAHAFMSVRFPILPLVRPGKQTDFELILRNPKLFTPRDFDYSPYFDIIKYPIFPLSGMSTYKDLPWRDDLMSHDEAGIERLKPKTDSTEPDKQD